MELERFFIFFTKVVTIGANLLQPYVYVNGTRKLSKLFFFSLAVHLEWVLVMVTFIPVKFADLSDDQWSELTENAGVLISVTRSCFYHLLLMLSADKMRLMLQRIITDRDSVRAEDKMWQLTLRQCRIEFLASTVFVLGTQAALVLVSIGPLLIQYNEYRLPFNFYIVCFPIHGLSLNWLINYFNQICYCMIVGPMVTIYFALILFLMNHSCWGLDMLRITVGNLEALSETHDRDEPADVASITEQLRKTVEKSYEAINWHQEVQELLKFNFMLEFSILSFVFCACIYSLVLNPFGPAIIYMTFPVLVLQLYIYCLMGKRISDRVEDVTTAIYSVNWAAMKGNHRRDLQLILVMMQNMRGFNGIFQDVNMRTFQKIMELTYHLIALLKSTT